MYVRVYSQMVGKGDRREKVQLPVDGSDSFQCDTLVVIHTDISGNCREYESLLLIDKTRVKYKTYV